MAEQTDLALEIADLCDELNERSPEPGDAFLASKFGVPAWSPEFFQILFAVTGRVLALEAMLTAEGASVPVMQGAKRHIAAVIGAFDKGSLANEWRSKGVDHVSPANSSPIRMLSLFLSQRYSYPKLTSEEIEEVKSLAADLLSMLKDHQLSERDFIREALIEGLEHFSFRMERLKWFGWGYSIASLREVLMAYFALERGLDPQTNPDAGAMLKRMETGLRGIFKYTGLAKEAAETGDWAYAMLKAAVKFGASGGGGFVAGLLTHGT